MQDDALPSEKEFADDSTSDLYEQNRESGLVLAAATDSIYTLYDIKYSDNWEPENRHWIAPTGFTVSSDGTIEVYAKKLASMWRRSIIDDGPPYTYVFEIFFRDKTGKDLLQINVKLAEVRYRQELHNFRRSQKFENCIATFNASASVAHRRKIFKRQVQDAQIIGIPLPNVPGYGAPPIDPTR